MNPPTQATVELSALDQIRQAEVEVARRIAVAREAADATLEEARTRAEDMKRQARMAGRCAGLAQYQENVSKAEEEARCLIAQANSEAQCLRQYGELCMEAAVRYATGVVLGQEMEAESAWLSK